MSERKAGLRPMKTSEHRRFFKRIQQDFPAGEYPPYFVMNQQLKEGDLEGLVFTSEAGEDLAYAMNASGHPNKWVLISYLAVMPEQRGTGVGTAFLNAMAHQYREAKCLMVEVESPEAAETFEERQIRERRLRFYERAGYRLIGGISYQIWGVSMHLMILPLTATLQELLPELSARMHEIYLDLMGRIFIHKMELTGTPEEGAS